MKDDVGGVISGRHPVEPEVRHVHDDIRGLARFQNKEISLGERDRGR